MQRNRVILIFILCMLFFSNAFSQNIEGVNARLDAMAGSAAADDIGWTVRHPASIYKFPNHFQGSVGIIDIPGVSETFGTIIGVLQINEFLFFGATYNNRRIMSDTLYVNDSFYIYAGDFLDFPLNADTMQFLPLVHIPQVNLCFKFNDNIQLGIGGYFEGTAFDYIYKKKLPYDPAVGTVQDTISYTAKRHDNKRIRNNGFNVELRLNFGNLTLYPQVMVGFPKIKGAESYDTLDNAMAQFAKSNAANPLACSNVKHTWSSPQGLYLRGGSYLWGDIGNTFCFGGAVYENIRSQFKRNTKIETGVVDIDGSLVGDTLLVDENFDSTQSDHNLQWIHGFFSFVPPFSDELYFSPEYNGGIGWYTAKDPDTPPDTTHLIMYHNIRLGIEKSIEDFWWFDKLALRCGVQGQYNKQWVRIENPDDTTGTSTSDETMPWTSFFWHSNFREEGKAKVTGGFGISKGRGTFGVSCDFFNWQGKVGGKSMGVLTGPNAAMATITVDFSRKKEF